jgi:hypothetical protein
MLNEIEGLRAREAQLQSESDARLRELKSQAELLATQRTIVNRDAASAARCACVESLCPWSRPACGTSTGCS